MTKSELTPKQEVFCQQIAVGKAQSDAYRAAFNTKRMKAKTVHEAASRLMGSSKVRARVKELCIPILVKVRKSREEYLDLLEAITFHDPGKMFDALGNPLEPNEMDWAERVAIASYDVTEDFIGRKNEAGQEDRVACGYTKKFRLHDRHKFAVTYGKMMGYLKDKDDVDDPETLRSKSIQVVFVNSQNAQVNAARPVPATVPRAAEPPKPLPGVTFVKSPQR